MGNFKIKSIWESKNTGGANVPTDLQNRLQAVETKASSNETSINNLNNTAVKTSGDQSIAGVKTFTQPLIVATPTANANATTKEYVDNKFKYVRKINNNGFTINANAYQSAEYTINGLTMGLNEFYVVLTTSSVDIGFEVKIQCNNLNYPNMSEIKTISISNFSNSNVDNLGTILVGFIVYGNNKFRFRMKNLHSSNITFNGYRVYHRIPGALANN